MQPRPAYTPTLLFTVAALGLLAVTGGADHKDLTPSHTAAAHTDAEIQRFNAWLRVRSTTPPLLEAATTDDMGLGLVVAAGATKHVRKGTMLLELPLTATLSRDSGASYGHLLAAENEEQYVVEALLVEYALGTASSFHPWITVLPTLEQMDTPSMWGNAEQAWIEPKSNVQMVAALARHVKESYNRAKRIVFPKLQSYVTATSTASQAAGKVVSLPSDAWSFDRYAWAHALVDTRAWNLEGRKMLVPGADFFNHDEDDDDRAYDFTQFVVARSQKFLTHHHLTTVSKSKGRSVRVLRVLSDRDAGPPGSPLYESYGDNTNDIYFAYHGFLPKQNARDCQKVALSRGVQAHERAAIGTAMEGLLAQLRGHSRDVWSQTICVHRDEYPPLLELVGWLVAVGRVPDAVSKGAIQACIAAKWRRWQAVAPPGYQRDASLLKQLRTCVALDAVVTNAASADLAAYLRLVNMSHRVQHTIVMASAKAEFSTLKTAVEVSYLGALDDGHNATGATAGATDGTSMSRRRALSMRLRLERKTMLRGLLARIRLSQEAAVTAAMATGTDSVGDAESPRNFDL